MAMEWPLVLWVGALNEASRYVEGVDVQAARVLPDRQEVRTAGRRRRLLGGIKRGRPVKATCSAVPVHHDPPISLSLRRMESFPVSILDFTRVEHSYLVTISRVA